MDAIHSNTKQDAFENLQAALGQAEEALRTHPSFDAENAHDLRAQMEQLVRQAKEDMHRLQEALLGGTKATGQAANDYVHKNPWQSAGIAAGLGLIVGLLIGRR